jgi:hypothetical protein
MDLDIESFDETINEISPKTLIKWYISTEDALKSMQYKLTTYCKKYWEQINQELSDSHSRTYGRLSEDFIRKYQEKVNWKIIAKTHNLSENFIMEFQDRLNFINDDESESESESESKSN